MLLQKIKLKGFLGHRGVLQENGAVGFVEVDFSSAALWLVHGVNGCGKSSLWDALTFAFFKQHRGGASNFARLVHDQADKAEICVEFEFAGQALQLCGSIGKTKSGNANTNRILQRRNDGDWETTHDGEARVKAWLDEHWRISYKTFTSAVLLRQGEADVFLTAGATERRERLLQLLNLKFYRELGTRAERCKNTARDRLKEIQQTLEALPNPTDEAITIQTAAGEQADKDLEKLNRQKSDKETELNNARQAETWQTEIKDIRERQAKDKPLFTRAEAIRQNAARWRALEIALIHLDNLWKARDEYQQAETSLAEKRRERKDLDQQAQSRAAYRTARSPPKLSSLKSIPFLESWPP